MEHAASFAVMMASVRRLGAGLRRSIFRQAVIENGVKRGVDVVEIYPFAVEDAELRATVHEAHETLAGREGRA
ncbi:MAG: hypothetical protein HYX75_04390 [Acidobacteria bacterium]|nr:hypothetical protein [Acidobacteriota bacterium]